jgi:hypothetical protein
VTLSGFGYGAGPLLGSSDPEFAPVLYPCVTLSGEAEFIHVGCVSGDKVYGGVFLVH